MGAVDIYIEVCAVAKYLYIGIYDGCMYDVRYESRYAFFGLLLLPFPHPERTKVRVVGRYSESSVSPQISFSRRGGVRRARNAPQTFGRSMIA